MLKIRKKRAAGVGARAVAKLAEVNASVIALSNDDLLDLADIFKGNLQNPLAQAVFGEMTKRNISLEDDSDVQLA